MEVIPQVNQQWKGARGRPSKGKTGRRGRPSKGFKLKKDWGTEFGVLWLSPKLYRFYRTLRTRVSVLHYYLWQFLYSSDKNIIMRSHNNIGITRIHLTGWYPPLADLYPHQSAAIPNRRLLSPSVGCYDIVGLCGRKMIVLSSENMIFLLPRVPYACGNAFGTISEKYFFSMFSSFWGTFLDLIWLGNPYIK